MSLSEEVARGLAVRIMTDIHIHIEYTIYMYVTSGKYESSIYVYIRCTLGQHTSLASPLPRHRPGPTVRSAAAPPRQRTGRSRSGHQ